jgi:hypothetical protein
MTIPSLPTLSATTVVKTIITKIIFYAILCILAALLINRWFTIRQRHAIFSHTLVALVVVPIFLILFPILYLWQIKSLAMIDTLRYLWATYRDEIVHLVIDKVIARGREQSLSASSALSSSTPAKILASLRTQFPGVIGWLFDYCTQKFPIVQKIPEILGGIDFTNPDATAIKQRVMEKLQPYLGDTQNAPGFGYGVRKLIAWNVVLLGGVWWWLQ